MAIVTPSALGCTIVDWITTGTVDTLETYVKYWIPVASFSVGNADEKKLEELKNKLHILAMYGTCTCVSLFCYEYLFG